MLWAMVNTLLLSEARARGFGIYRNVVRRVGLGLEAGRVLTKGRLREILAKEDRLRVLVGQLSTVGREHGTRAVGGALAIGAKSSAVM